jgi:hypothetical protein
MNKEKKTKKDKKDKGIEKKANPNLCCCYVIDPCGCYVDPCGSYMSSSCCC